MPVLTVLTAIIAATVFAIFGFPFRHYQCWFSFSTLGTALGSALYLVLAGGGGGLLGLGAAQLAGVKHTGSPALDGLLYGISGALVLRADFGAGPKPDTAPDQLAPARSILTAGINWTADLLDAITARHAEAWLTALPDDRLAREALRVQYDIRHQPDNIVSDKAKKEMSRMLVPTMEQLNEDAHRDASRADLISFCTRYYTERHFPKTPRRRH
jgi:hypothetical protein